MFKRQVRLEAVRGMSGPRTAPARARFIARHPGASATLEQAVCIYLPPTWVEPLILQVVVDSQQQPAHLHAERPNLLP